MTVWDLARGLTREKWIRNLRAVYPGPHPIPAGWYLMTGGAQEDEDAGTWHYTRDGAKTLCRFANGPAIRWEDMCDDVVIGTKHGVCEKCRRAKMIADTWGIV